MSKKLLEFTNIGIYCPIADVFIDPWKPVKRAIITHAHADHARPGSRHYAAHQDSAQILKLRLGDHIQLETYAYDEIFTINGVKISLHPAGHTLGSAQVRLEHKGEVWVISGDYKVENDHFCTPFAPVKCHHFISECTFGLPVFHWQPQAVVMQQINDWWRKNQQEGKTSVIFAYALGKAQRIIHNIDHAIGKIYVHGAIHNINHAIAAQGIKLPETTLVSADIPISSYPGQLVIATGSAMGTPWMRKFQPYETASVSGWMSIRGMKKRRSAGHGFVMSDHADWQGLNAAIKATGAENIYVTHGYKSVFSKWLCEQGYNASEVDTLFEGESQSLEETDHS